MGSPVVYNIPPTVDPSGDTFRFGQMVETVKSVFVIELQKFFGSWQYLSEIPNIEKFHFDDPRDREDDGQLLTWTHIIMQYPDIGQRLPLIAVTTASGTQRKMSFGTQYVGTYWKIPVIKTGTYEPFALEDKMTLNYSTTAGVASIIFLTTDFPNINSVTAQELAERINYSAPLLQASVFETTVNDQTRRGVMLQSMKPPAAPDYIEISASGDLNVVLGIVAGTKDDTTILPPIKRYQYCMDMNIGLDIGAESETLRKELVDLLMVFMQFYMQDRNFEFHGAANMPDGNGDIYPQPFQIIMSNAQSKSGESEVPRPDGDGSQKIYVDRYTIPVTMLQFLDRPLGADQGVVTSIKDP